MPIKKSQDKTFCKYCGAQINLVKIIPELLRLIHCPKCGTWSLYIYNRYKNDELNYISYQYEVHEYKEECKDSFKCIGDLIDY